MFGRTYTNSYIIIIITSKKKKSYIIKYLNLTLRSRFDKLYFAQKKKKKNLTSYTYNNNCFFKGKGTVASDFY